MEIAANGPFCVCGIPAVLKTSWSNDNPGRRFYGCRSYGNRLKRPCRFFEWLDPPISPPRARVVLVGILRKLRALERRQRNDRIILVLFAIVWAVGIWYFK